jgi:glycerol uptake facilitator protein
VSIFGAEVIGTALLVLFGNGVVAGVVLRHSKAENSGWIVITFGWGMAVMIAVYAVGQYDGAHLNPAVTLAFAIKGAAHGGIKWSQTYKYWGGEFVGAFIGATLVWLAYLPHWAATEDQGSKLACFSTAPAIRKPLENLVCEIIGTFALVFGVLAIVNNKAPGTSGIIALLIGLLVFAIGLSLGGPTGYAINPARDLGPRIMHAILPIAGKGGSDWQYAWIPVVGPLIGGALGSALFIWFYPGA